jgi:CheY-like chemotaxis protein
MDAPGPTRKRPRVLVVEDEDDIRTVVLRNLELRGYEAHGAASVAEALASCAAAPPDVLVLDINLPDATGWDVLRGLGQSGLPPPRVIAVSAAPPAQRRLAEFEPLTFLPKPFPITALLRAIERATQEDGNEARPDPDSL